MNRIRVTSKGWDGFTGLLGMVQFVDGVSVEPVTRIMIDRIAAAVSVVEIDENGNEIPAGSAVRLIGGATTRAAVKAPLSRASAEDLSIEKDKIAEGKGIAPAQTFYTAAELEAIADEKGIGGLREIAKPWRVRDRSIPGLIGEILKAQGEFQKRVAAATDETPAPADDASHQDDTPASPFAESYEIGDKTVSLKEIREGALVTFGGDVVAWDALSDDERNDLVRLELDRLLGAQ